MKKYCSIAEKPGTFGERFHNAGYKELGLDSVYLAVKVESSQLRGFMELVRDNFSGVSVSKPHKIGVIQYLDSLDDSASRVGAVNTILNTNGHLRGFNTDYFGAKKAISSSLELAGKRVVMLGAGGVARAIAYAVKDLGGDLIIINRDFQKAITLANETKSLFGGLEELGFAEGDLFINATSIGMLNPSHDSPLNSNSIRKFNAIMDVVVAETKLIQDAKSLDKIVIPGKVMTAYQAEKQFEIYASKKLPPSFVQSFAIN